MDIPWTIEEQTRVKHALLQGYINPWMSILLSQQASMGKQEILIYLDGFSGPGKYFTDETKAHLCDGSPLIVAEIANKYLETKPQRKIYMFCIDKEKDCVEYLEKQLKEYNKFAQGWFVFQANFEDKVNEILDVLEQKYLTQWPMFFFVDPFGYSGYTLKTMRRIMQYPRAELFINYMVYDIVRFREQGYTEAHMNALFGCDDYKKMDDCHTPHQRQLYLKNLYCKCLESVGANYVMPFKVNSANMDRVRYYLIHASKNIKALKVMKDNMAKQSELPYSFEAVGRASLQGDLFEDPEKVSLKEKVMGYCTARYPNRIDYSQIEEWAYINTNGVKKTIQEVLLELEQNATISIERKPRQHKNKVNDGALILANRQQ